MSGIDLNMVGIILMVVGAIGLLMSMIFWSTWGGFNNRTERTVVRYCDFTSLVADLRALGETNALAQRSRKVLRRDVLDAALGRYAATHAEPDGRIRATFDIIYLTGMAP